MALRRLFLFLPLWFDLLPALGLMALSAAVGLVTPYLVKLIVDGAIAQQDVSAAWRIAVLGVFVYAAGFFLNYLSRWRIAQLGENAWHDLRQRVFEHLQSLSAEHHHSARLGDLLARTYSDTNAVKQLLVGVLPSVVYVTVTIAGTAAVLLYLAPRLVLVSFAAVPVAVALAYLLRKKIPPLTRRMMEQYADVQATITEGLSSVDEVKVYGGERRFADALEREGQALVTKQLALQRYQIVLRPAINFALAIVLMAVLAVGGTMVIEGALTVGTLFVFYYYIARSFEPVRSVSGLVAGWHQAAAALARVDELLTLREALPVAPSPQPLPARPHRFTLKDVSFRYSSRETAEGAYALRNVSLSIGSGEHVAVLGPSGAGKTTTGKLFARLFDPDEGSVELNGVPVSELCPRIYRKTIGYVGQEVFILGGSIRENICFGLSEPPAPEVLSRALEVSCVQEIVDQRQEGLAAQVGERGVRLSGGQRKRIALARALIREPSLLIIDQLASDLQVALNRAIFSSLPEEYPSLAVLYLGHRIPAAFQPDRVFWMEGGRLREKSDRATGDMSS